MKKITAAIFLLFFMVPYSGHAYDPVLEGETIEEGVIQDGTQDVYGTVINTTIKDNGIQNIKEDGEADRTQIQAGGVQNVEAGGEAKNTTISGFKDDDEPAVLGVQRVFGTAHATTINIHGVQYIENGGHSHGGNINLGGVQNVKTGGTAHDMIIRPGGEQNVAADGTAISTNIFGIQNLAAGAQTSGWTHIRGDGVQNISHANNIGTHKGTEGDDNDRRDTIFISGGTQNINTGADIGQEAASHIVMTGGTQNIRDGARIDGMRIAGSSSIAGTQNVYAASAGNTIIERHGTQVWKKNGATIFGENTVNFGGRMVFETDAVTVNAGTELLLNGGRLALGGNLREMTFGSNLLIEGTNGIVEVNLRPGDDGKESDFFDFRNIKGTFLVAFGEVSASDAHALNLLNDIKIIEYNHALGATFDNLGNGIDVGIWNWRVIDDGAGTVTAVRSNSKSYLALTSTNHVYSVRSTVAQMSNSMHRRMGELQWLDGTDATQAATGADARSGAWARGIFKRSRHQAHTRATATLTGAEFGYDFKVRNAHDEKLFVGVLGYSAASEASFDSFGNHNDTNNVDAWGVGLYTIWLGEDGLFGDAVMRLHFINQDTTAWAAGGSSATTFDTSHWAASLNMEFGAQYVLCGLYRECVFLRPEERRENFEWVLTPRAGLNLAYTSGSDFTTVGNNGGINGRLRGGWNTAANAGVQYGPRWTFADKSKLQLYAKTGLIADFSNSSTAVFDGMLVSDRFDASGIEFGGGMNFRSANMRFMTYLDISTRMGWHYDEFAGVFGLRYTF